MIKKIMWNRLWLTVVAIVLALSWGIVTPSSMVAKEKMEIFEKTWKNSIFSMQEVVIRKPLEEQYLWRGLNRQFFNYLFHIRPNLGSCFGCVISKQIRWMVRWHDWNAIVCSPCATQFGNSSCCFKNVFTGW